MNARRQPAAPEPPADTRADRAAVIVDAAAYFDAIASACEKASASIFIIGWAMDTRTRLRRDGVERPLPDALGPMLSELTRRNPGLRVHVLAWDFAMLFGLQRDFLPLFRTGGELHRRVQWELDSEHAFGASQHQKLVVVDDRIAFVSGMDLTLGRWDTREHIPDDPRRDGDGAPDPPHHDVGIVFDGEAAAAAGLIARERWLRATGRPATPALARLRERIPALASDEPLGQALDTVQRATRRVRDILRDAKTEAPAPSADPWPDGVEPGWRDLSITLCRTEAAYVGRPARREIEGSWLRAIASARRSILIENQYFTSVIITQALERRLAEADGPEVVILQPLRCSGWLEQATVGAVRDQRLRRLRDADAGGRLRVLYPVADDGSPITLHSKLLIVDDAFVQVGSANASNRSLALDTELDATFRSADRPEHARAITRLRDDLLAEHLGVSADVVARAIAREGSVGRATDALRGSGRSLLPLSLDAPDWLLALVPESLADPELPRAATPEPADEDAAGAMIPEVSDRATPWQTARAVAVVVALVALTLTWTLTPLGAGEGARTIAEALGPLHEHPLAPFVALVAYVVLGLVAFPISVLVLASVLAFGPVLGSVVAITGGMASAVASYIQGRVIGRRWVRRFGGRRLNRVSRVLGTHGVVAVAVARLLPFVPWTLTSVVAGASHVRPLEYLFGTLLGLVPGVLAAAILSDATTSTGVRALVEVAVFGLLAAATWSWTHRRLATT